MSSPPSSSDHQIRSRLLNRLGIYDAPATVQSQQPMTAAQHRRLRILRGMGVGHTLRLSPPDGSAVRMPLDGVVPFQEPLKTDVPPSEMQEQQQQAQQQQQQEAQEPSSSSDTKSSKASNKKSISFQDEVEVMPIPTRYEYSDRIKSRIWSNRHELQENAERNALEFAAEGWNWRSVTEDEGMFICSVSGELVHPIHLQHLVQDEGERTGLERGSPVH